MGILPYQMVIRIYKPACLSQGWIQKWASQIRRLKKISQLRASLDCKSTYLLFLKKILRNKYNSLVFLVENHFIYHRHQLPDLTHPHPHCNMTAISLGCHSSQLAIDSFKRQWVLSWGCGSVIEHLSSIGKALGEKKWGVDDFKSPVYKEPSREMSEPNWWLAYIHPSRKSAENLLLLRS